MKLLEGWALFDGLSMNSPFVEQMLKATVLVLLAWAVSLLFRRATASARHLVWMAALLAVMALPVLSGTLPSWRVEMLPAAAAPLNHQASAPGEGADKQDERLVSTGVVAQGESAVGHAATANSPSARTISRSGANVLLLLWVVGAALVGSWLAMSVLSAWLLVRRSTPIKDPDALGELADLRQALGLRRPVSLVESRRISMPMAWGILRQTVLLPSSARDWSADRRRVVLLHELAHLKRRDCETLLVARAVAALHWFNPLVWFAVRKLQAEREHACDDLVLASGARSTEYAQHLLGIARSARSGSTLGWAMVGMARRTELEGRLLAILTSGERRSGGAKLVHLVGVAVVALVALPLAALKPAAVSRGSVAEEVAEEIAEEVAEEPMSSSEPRPATLAHPEPAESVETESLREAEPSIEPAEQASISSEPQQETRARSDEESPRMSRVIEAFAVAVGDVDAGIRAEAAHSLGMLQNAAAVPLLTPLVESDAVARVRQQAAWALGMIQAAAAVPGLTQALSDESASVRREAAWALGMIQSDGAVAGLNDAVADENAGVREKAAWALGMIESSAGARALISSLENDQEASVRKQAAWGLGMIGSSAAVHTLSLAVQADSSEMVREKSAWALGMIGVEDGLDSLLNAMSDDSAQVRKRALWAVGHITG